MVDPFGQFDNQVRRGVLGIIGLAFGLAFAALRAVFALVMGLLRLITRTAGRQRQPSASLAKQPAGPAVHSVQLHASGLRQPVRQDAGGPGNVVFPIALLAVAAVSLPLTLQQTLQASAEPSVLELLAESGGDSQPSSSSSSGSSSSSNAAAGSSDDQNATQSGQARDDTPSRVAEVEPATTTNGNADRPGSAGLDCPGQAPLENEPYQVRQIQDVLNGRSSPSTEADVVVVLQPIEGPLYFIGCSTDTTGRVWWLTEWDYYVASEYIERLRPLNNCSRAVSPSTERVYRVDAELPNGPLQIRSGPGVEYDPPLGELEQGRPGLRFRGCTLSSEGGAWWMLQNGGYVFAAYVSPES